MGDVGGALEDGVNNVVDEVGRGVNRIKEDPSRLFTYGVSVGGRGFGLTDWSGRVRDVTGVTAMQEAMDKQNKQAREEARRAELTRNMMMKQEVQRGNVPDIFLGASGNPYRSNSLSNSVGISTEDEENGTGLQL